jgi:amino acid adenylation domain-containing protein
VVLFLRSGDLGFLHGEELFITGRLKDLLIIHGVNHYPQDIELTVGQCHPALNPSQCAAFSVDVQGGERLVIAAEVSRVYGDVPNDAIASAVREAVADVHELGVHEVVLLGPGAIPKTSSGKIQRHACRIGYIERTFELRAPAREVSADAQPDRALPGESGSVATELIAVSTRLSRRDLSGMAPSDRARALERYLVGEISQVLGTRGEHVDPTRPVTHYGFDSIMAVGLRNRIELDLGVVVPSAMFLEAPSISQLVPLLDELVSSSGAQEPVCARANNETAAWWLENLERLSDSEVEALLKMFRTIPVASMSDGGDKDAAGEKRLLLARLLRQMSSQSSTRHAASYNQQSLWFAQQLFPGSAAYAVSFAARCVGPLEADRLEQALQGIVDSHPAFRTGFAQEDGVPVQYIQRSVPIRLVIHDSSGWTDAELVERTTEAASRPFDLSAPPLFRANLLSRSATDHVLLLTAHHIIVDLWSLSLLVQELGERYGRSRSKSSTQSLSPPGHHYTDYVSWQRELLSSAEGDRLQSYWREQLSGCSPVLELPTDRQRPPVHSHRGERLGFQLTADLTERLRRFAAQEHVTLNVLLLAAFNVLLHRHAQQSDLLVGSVSSGRSRAQFAPIVGYFVNPLVVRSKTYPEQSFRSFLRSTRETMNGAIRHQDYSFSLLVERLEIPRDLSRHPLFQVAFGFERSHHPDLRNLPLFFMGHQGVRQNVGEMLLQSYPLQQPATPYDLMLLMTESSSCICGTFEYAADLFERQTISRYAARLETLLEALLADPDMSVSRLPLLTVSEQQELLAEPNQTHRSFGEDRCLHELFELQAAVHPEAIAVEDDEHQVTYRELNLRANRVARRLRRMGVVPDFLVGIFAERSVESVVATLAVLKAGGAYVPLDPSYPQERLAYMVADADLRVVVTQPALAESLRRVLETRQQKLSQPTLVFVDAEATGQVDEGEDNLAGGATIESAAYVIYTSGSTGLPKGVVVPHRGLQNLAAFHRDALGVTPASRVLQFSPLSFDASVWELVMALANGATLRLVSQDTLAHGPDLVGALRKHRISVVTLSPSVLTLVDPEGLPELQTVIAAGEACSAEIVSRWGKGRRFINAYGPTETTVCASYAVCDVDAALAPSIGQPLPNTQIYLLDAQLQPVPIGVPGELHIGGIGLAHRYLHRPELTDARFIVWSFEGIPAARLFRTGDLARYRSDGSLEFLGRIDHQVKLRGFRIELGEIEAVLRSGPGIRDAVVLLREDRPGDKRLAAYVLLTAGAHGKAPSAAELRAFASRALPDYMVPNAFVPLDAWPLSPSGKVDRAALPAPAGMSASGGTPDAGYVAPRTELEASIATISANVLGVDRVGIHDDFFARGGHSLLATQAVTRLNQAFDLNLGIRALYVSPTVAALADVVTQLQCVNQIKVKNRDGGAPGGSLEEFLL